MQTEVDTTKLDEYLTVMQSIDHDLSGRAIDQFYATPEIREAYHKHLEAFAATDHFRVVGVMGSNRSGKSTLACFYMAISLTGEYPDWWKGKRFKKPINAWVVAVTQAQARDNLQAKLLGEHGERGTGLIPRDAILEVRNRQGVPGGVEYVRVRHKSGGTSTLTFKAASEQREAFQSVRIDLAVLDEECPWPVFEEVLMRTIATGEHEEPGSVMLAFTPLKGMSEVVSHLMPDGLVEEDKTRDVCTVNIPWDDVPHLSPEEKQSMLDNIPRHQVDARIKGLPVLGVGAVYSFNESDLVCEPFEIPPYYWGAAGFDVGWRFSGAVFVRKDPDSGVFYFVDEVKMSEATPPEVAAAINARSRFMRIAIDPASRGRSQLDGRNLMSEYRDLGLSIFPADNSVEAGLHKVQMLMTSGKLKIFPTCTRLLAELRKYSRNEDGKIRKMDDHALDAMRYCLFTEKVMTPLRPFTKPKVIKCHK